VFSELGLMGILKLYVFAMLLSGATI